MDDLPQFIHEIFIRFEIADDKLSLLTFSEDSKHTTAQEVDQSSTWTTNLEQLLGKRNYHHIDILTLVSEEISKMSEENEDTGAAAPLEWETIFFSGNPAVETAEGIIHLYKDNERVNLLEDGPRSSIVCILSVPSFMNMKDVMTFLAAIKTDIVEMKIIKDDTPNRYMIIIKFKSEEHADDFYKNYNNTKFNTLETEVCHLCFVSRVESMKASTGASFPLKGFVELPNCPVCLERMDESVDGLLTVFCNHTFHGSCISKWSDTSCPVCRYVQTPEPASDQGCAVCETHEDLWICLICGLIGCGRYGGGHSQAHFYDTNHTFALELGSNRVWDYAGDNYVHRIIQNKSDGKPVEVDADKEEKMDALHMEMTYMLTSQLESQRLFYEDRQRIREEALLEKLDLANDQSLEASKHATDLEQRVQTLEKDRQILERKCNTLQTKVTKLSQELSEEKQFNNCLQKNQVEWETKYADEKNLWKQSTDKKEKELVELREQLRDLMFFVESRDKLAACQDVSVEELEQSQVVVNSSGASGSHRKRRSNTRKK